MTNTKAGLASSLVPQERAERTPPPSAALHGCCLLHGLAAALSTVLLCRCNGHHCSRIAYARVGELQALGGLVIAREAQHVPRSAPLQRLRSRARRAYKEVRRAVALQQDQR